MKTGLIKSFNECCVFTHRRCFLIHSTVSNVSLTVKSTSKFRLMKNDSWLYWKAQKSGRDQMEGGGCSESAQKTAKRWLSPPLIRRAVSWQQHTWTSVLQTESDTRWFYVLTTATLRFNSNGARIWHDTSDISTDWQQSLGGLSCLIS